MTGKRQGQRGREGGGGIEIEPEIKVRGGEGVCTESGIGEAPLEGGRYRKSGGEGSLSGAVFLLQYQRLVEKGTGTCLLLCQLSSLELVPMFTGGWRTEEREVGQNIFQELTRVEIVDRGEVGKKG